VRRASPETGKRVKRYARLPFLYFTSGSGTRCRSGVSVDQKRTFEIDAKNISAPSNLGRPCPSPAASHRSISARPRVVRIRTMVGLPPGLLGCGNKGRRRLFLEDSLGVGGRGGAVRLFPRSSSYV
ncbi:hypothetical protein B296_00037359, partial [Ensete ventricosum]